MAGIALSEQVVNIFNHMKTKKAVSACVAALACLAKPLKLSGCTTAPACLAQTLKPYLPS